MSAASPGKLQPRRIGRRILLVFAALLLSLLLLLGLASFLLSTPSGSQWVLASAMQRLQSGGVSLTVDGIEGTIFRGLSFRRISLSDESGDYTIEGLRTSWNPYSLLSGQLLLSDLWISSLRIELKDSGEASDAKLDAGIIANPVPIGVSVSRLRLERLELIQQGQQLTLRSIALGAELADSGLSVTALQLAAEGLELAGDFSLGLSEAGSIAGRFDWRYAATLDASPLQFAGRLELGGDLNSIELVHRLQSPQLVNSNGRVTTGLFEGDFGFDIDHSAASLLMPVETQVDYALNNVLLGTSGNLEEISLSLRADLRYEQYPNIALAADAVYAGSMLSLSSYSLGAAGNSIEGEVIVDWSDVPTIRGDYALRLPSIESLAELPESVDIEELAGAGEFDIALPDAGAEGRLSLATLSASMAGFPVEGAGEIQFRQGTILLDDLRLQTRNNQLGLSGSYSDTLDLNWSIAVGSLQEFLLGAGGALEGSGSLRGDPAAPNIVGTLSGRDLAYRQFGVDQLSFDFSRIDRQLQSELSIETFSYSDAERVETVAPLRLKVSGTEASHRIDLTAQTRYGDFVARLSGAVRDLQNISWQGRLESAAVDTPVGSWRAEGTSALSISGAGIDVGQSCWLQLDASICFEFEQSGDSGISASGSIQDYPLAVFNYGQSLDGGASIALAQEQLLSLPQLPQGAAIAGLVDGQFSLALAASGEPRFDFELSAGDSVLSVTPELLVLDENIDAEPLIQEYKLEVLSLSGGLASGSWRLRAGAEILQENFEDSEIGVRGVIGADVGIAATGELSGSVDAGLEDLRWLQALVPQLSNIGGSLNGRAIIGGSLSAPQATGAIDLRDASVSIASLGIDIENVSANVSSDSPDSIQMTGRAQSGAGALDFSGEIVGAFAETTVFSAELRGENFQLASIPNLELNVSPNAVLTIDETGIEVIGSLDVPTLRLTLEQLPETAVDVSRDVVIVNYPSDRPDLARSIAATESTAFDRPLMGAIDITLGDDVSFSGFGMNTKLAGNLNIQQTAAGSNRTYGELTIVEGSYEMYRQSLNISQGKFLFFGAYDNPGIDLRATREVDDYTVGVLMNGTLKNINSQLYSTPALADNDIIAVLVTGRPFSEVGEQDGDALLSSIASLGLDRSEGLTNQVRNKLGLDVLAVDPSDDINNSVLTIGKYLTPDIFIRYGIGLFDSQSKLAVDYTISDRVKLKAESGEYQSVDIIYSVER